MTFFINITIMNTINTNKIIYEILQNIFYRTFFIIYNYYFYLLSKIIPRYMCFSTVSPSIVVGETAGGCFLKSISNSFVFVTLRSNELS